jgi:hypothetical protein
MITNFVIFHPAKIKYVENLLWLIKNSFLEPIILTFLNLKSLEM